jgi:phosphoribosylformylglycinamidine synthase
MALRRGVGATVAVPQGIDPFVFLLSESAGRALVTAPVATVAEVEALAAEFGVPVARIGVVGAEGDDLVVEGVYGDLARWPLAELRSTADATLPALFG